LKSLTNEVIHKFLNLNLETDTLLAFRFDTEEVQFQLPVIGTTTLPTVLVQLNSQVSAVACDLSINHYG